MNDPGAALRLRWRWILAIAALGLLLHVQAAWVGFAGDDYVHLAMLDGVYPGTRNPFEMFVFYGRDPQELAAHVAFGTAPWWTVPEFHGAVLRPLASALIWMDGQLFPLAPGPAHAHSLLWWVGAIVAAGLCLRRIVPAPVAALALVLFAVDDAVTVPIAWLANRAVLVSALFSFVALWSHVRGHDEAWRPAPWVEAGAWVLAFAAGEYAISGAAFVLAHTLVFARGRGIAHFVRALIPAAGSLLVYMTLHRALGYGTVGSAVYVDPFAEPFAYASWALSRIPGLWAELIVGLPSNLGELAGRLGFGWAWWLGATPTTSDLFRAAAFLAVAGCGLGLVPLLLTRRRLEPGARRHADWLVLGAFMGLIPVAAAPAHGRLLVLPNLGASVAIAWILYIAVRDARARPRTAGGFVLGACAGLLAAVHLFVEPREVVRENASFRVAHEQITASLTRPELAAVDFEGKRVVLVAAGEPTTGIHGHLVLHALGRRLPRSWHVLSMTSSPHALTRAGPRALELSSIGTPMLLEPPERFFRPAASPVRLGERFVAGEMQATVLAVRDGGADRVRFEFAHDLDPDTFVLLIAGREGLSPVEVPSVGKSIPVPIPRVPGLGPSPLPGRW